MPSYLYIFSILLFIFTNLPMQSWARPEYAASTQIVNCALCHVSPYGGGPRNLTGKIFAARTEKISWLANQPYASLDIRGQVYSAQRTPPDTSQSKGLMIMNVIPTLSLPLGPDPKVATADQLVLSYNFAPVGNSMREAFWLHQLTPANELSWTSSVLVGNFIAPFGLLTDEHRTYTKQMVAKTNRNFESGALLAGDPSHKVHYDLAITSGFSNGGTGTNTHPNSWGTFANVRHQVGNTSLQIGLSQAIEGATDSKGNMTATSLYGVYSFDKYTSPAFLGNIQMEVVSANGWNNSAFNTLTGDGIGYFIPSTATTWQAALNESNSVGFTSLINWDCNPRWTIQFKHEQFVPDSSYKADYFYRNGAGFKYYFGSFASILFRLDRGATTRPGLTNTDLASSKAVGDTYFTLLHIWL